MITNFEDYLNEGNDYHTWMLRSLKRDDANVVGFFFFFGAFGQFLNFISMNEWWHIMIYALGIFLAAPTLAVWYRGAFRDLYINIKSGKKNLIKADIKYRHALDKLEDNPDFKDELQDIKFNMAKAVKEGNRKAVANCVNKIELLAKKIKYRELLPDSFKLSPEEKENLRKREEMLKEKDPYGEEEWEDETIKESKTPYYDYETNIEIKKDPINTRNYKDMYKVVIKNIAENRHTFKTVFLKDKEEVIKIIDFCKWIRTHYDYKQIEKVGKEIFGNNLKNFLDMDLTGYRHHVCIPRVENITYFDENGDEHEIKK